MYLNAQKILSYLSFLFLLGMVACTQHPDLKKGKVYIDQRDGTYQLYRNGKPYFIKGASGFTHLNILKASGGNTIRVWDTVMLSTILKDANLHGITVIVGLHLPESRQMYFYKNQKQVEEQYQAIKRTINKYKSDPAILMWCVGNELSFPYRPSFNKFYTAFNDIVDMIHRDDPDHPVTTTMVNFQRRDIINIKLRTQVDLISFNVFGRLKIFKDDLKSFSWFYSDPYLITEWGIDGPWEGTPYTAWDAYIEPTSTKKAEQYLQRYKSDMPKDDPRYLGSFLFYWGQKQEVTATWFSLFDENGNPTEALAAAGKIWTGKTDTSAYPRINYMLMDNKGAADNIIYTPGQVANAELLMEVGSVPPKNIVWEIYQEDWYKKDNLNNSKALPPVRTSFTNTNNLKTSFTTPLKEGPYRLFVKVYANNGHIATANTPFYIERTNDKN